MRVPNRGFTLLELLVTTAIMSVVLVSVTGVVISLARQRRDSTTAVDTRTNGRLALSLISHDLQNAGFRFAAAPFAVRVLQNVTGVEAELADTVDCGTAGSGWTVMTGTDVIEIREGMGGLAPGKTALGVSGCAGSCTLVLQGSGSFPNPYPNMADGLDGVLIFSSAQASCAARLTTTIGPAGGVTLTMLQQDLRTGAPAAAYPQAGAFACPGSNMTVTAVGQVSRYMVCRPPVAAGALARPALFRQRFGNGTTWTTHDGASRLVTTDFIRIQDAVEDLQVAIMLDNTSSLVSGPSCTDSGTPAAACWCNDRVGGGICPQYVADATASGLLSADPAAIPSARVPYFPRAYRVAITTVADRGRGFGDLANIQRPESFDHAAGPRTWGPPPATLDANLRARYEMAVIPQNIVMVQP